MTRRGVCGTPGYARKGCRCEGCSRTNGERSRRYLEGNRDRVLAKKRIYNRQRYWENRESESERKRLDREENPQKYADGNKRYRRENVEKVRERSQRYYERNLDRIQSRAADYRSRNANKIREQRREYNAAIGSYYTDRERRLNAASKSSAGRIWAKWSPSEDIVVTDDSMSIMEIATALGRTYSAVTHRRAFLRKTAAVSGAR